MKKFVPSILASMMVMSCSQLSTNDSNELIAKDNTPKNIIMIVGDGMGPAYTTAYRYFHDDPTTAQVEQTVFDRHLVGSASTYPARVSGYVTDSAAGATALATATKSYNGAIGVDVDKKPVESVLVWAKKQGKKTGMVVTSQINHATPASYLAHNESRHNYNQIADNFLAAHDNIDVMLGGGWQYFIREDKNLVEEFKTQGFNYVDNYNQLTQLPPGEKVLGLFADSGLPWALDDSNKHRLSTMTKAAVSQLENKNGFFMLVEASQIDWGGHGNDIAAAMAEMDDLAKTLEFLEGYVKENPDTLVVLTADHSTGGFTLGRDGDYLWQPDVLRTMTMSPSAIAKNLTKNSITISYVNEMLNFTITDSELEALKKNKASAQKLLAEFKQSTKKKGKKAPSVEKALHMNINHIIDQRTVTGWTTFGHTAVDVPVFAIGKQKELFQGLSDNTEIADKIFYLLGKS
ncbi:alkaline phosphatase [Cognaticolwellia mytili]|uniref:alkaline phosphatase n=1 Tax=Cognaticolwellia mytili TaxID=1888913 RepID=UPI000A1745BC|nr:alkaline phosphatase [Cognaticolwellia mytili]